MMVSEFLDLAQTPPPQAIAELGFDDELDKFWVNFTSRDAAYNSLTDHDPARLLAHACALALVASRQFVNESTLGAMLAFAPGADLDALVAGRNLERALITEADPQAVPPVPAVYETDTELRRKALLKLESISSAGPRAAYLFHALKADPTIRDAFAYSPAPANARVVLLSRDDDGSVSAGTINTVFAALNTDEVRPITDQLAVVGALIVDYEIRVHLVIRPGVDPQILADQIQVKLLAFAEAGRIIGRDVLLSKIAAVGHTYQDGTGGTVIGDNVKQVDIISPPADVVIDRDSASYCTSVTVTHEVSIDG